MAAYEEPCAFGPYLRSIRQQRKLSLREIARSAQITPTYLSDLERGNNHPPDKALLQKLIGALGLQNGDEISRTLLDLAAEGRNDLPFDIKESVMNNRPLQQLIRRMQMQPDPEKFCAQLLHELS